MNHPLINENLGKYKIIRLEDENCAYMTFYAIDLEENAKKLVKIFQEDYAKTEKQKQLLYDKLLHISKLNHKNLIVPEEIGYEKNAFYVGLPFGHKSLANVCAKTGPITSIDAIFIAHAVGKALAYIHENKLLHMAISPFNIYMAENETIKLSGLGFIPNEEFILRSDIIDCPFYSAPELIMQKNLGGTVDLYSLGATLFHLLSGICPFEGKTTEEIFRNIIYSPAPELKKYRPNISEELNFLLTGLLQKDNNKRLPTAKKLVEITEKITKTKNVKITSEQDVESLFISILKKNVQYIDKVVSIFETIAKQKDAPLEVKNLMEKIAIQELSEKLDCDPNMIQEIKNCSALIDNPKEWIYQNVGQNIPVIKETTASPPEKKNDILKKPKSLIVKTGDRSGEYMKMFSTNNENKSNEDITKTANRSGEYMKMFSSPGSGNQNVANSTRRTQTIDFETYRKEKQKTGEYTTVEKKTYSTPLQNRSDKHETKIRAPLTPIRPQQHLAVNIVRKNIQKTEEKINSSEPEKTKSPFKFFLIFLLVSIILILVYVFLSPKL